MSPDLSAGKEAVELEVYRGEERVGNLRRTKLGARFAYDSEYSGLYSSDKLRAIAFGMPVRTDPFEFAGTNLHPFFAGLLPEGLRLRALVRGLKTSEDDLFSMLAIAGGNTVGDVWVKARGADLAQDVPLVDTLKIEQHNFDELLAQSLDWSKRGDSITVAGVQPKVSAAMISLPLRGRSRRREYILKLAPPEFPQLIENELFFMKLARSLKLSCAAVEVVHDSEGQIGLLVERFDRVPHPTDKAAALVRLHQEDACQLLGRYPADKYRLELREIAEALEVCSAPLVERLRLLQWQALSYLVGNGDMHGKNISVQVTDRRIQLTPIYDLLSTLPYGDEHLALKMDGRDKSIRRKQFLAFGERIGIRTVATEKMLDSLVQGVEPHLRRLSEIGFDKRKTRHLERSIEKRLGQLEK